MLRDERPDEIDLLGGCEAGDSKAEPYMLGCLLPECLAVDECAGQDHYFARHPAPLRPGRHRPGKDESPVVAAVPLHDDRRKSCSVLGVEDVEITSCPRGNLLPLVRCLSARVTRDSR